MSHPPRSARPLAPAVGAPRRRFLGGLAAGALSSAAYPAQPMPQVRQPLLKPRRLQPGDTIGLFNPSGAVFERQPYELAHESLAALGFRVREGRHLRARRGHFAGTDEQRAADLNELFADPGVHGLMAVSGGSGGTRILDRIDYAAIRREPKVLCGFSDLTAVLNAVQARTGLVTFHAPMAASEWNEYSVSSFRATVMEGRLLTLANPKPATDVLAPREGRTRTLRGGRASGVLAGGNLAVLAAMAGSAYWPVFDGAVLCLEEVNEHLYRVDRLLSTLKLAGALDRLAAVVIGAFTNCTPGEGYGTLTLDEILDDYFAGLGVPVYIGASFGHIRRKMTLPLGLPVEVDADAGTLRLLEPAVR